MKSFKTVTALVASISLAACASNPDKIASAYVSPLEYQGLSCGQLTLASLENNQAAADLAGSMSQKRNTNTGLVVVGAVLFWPALLFMKGKDPEADARLAELKGRGTAIDRAASLANCPDVPDSFAAAECDQLREELGRLVDQDRDGDTFKRNDLRLEIQDTCNQERS